MKRRLFALFLTLCMALTLLPGVALAEDIGESPEPAERSGYAPGAEAESESDATSAEPGLDNGAGQAEVSTRLKSDTDVAYAVTGGNIYFDVATGTITDCDESVTAVIIPDEINGVAVTTIGGWAFENCHDLEYISIPKSVVEIGTGGLFKDCTKLTTAGPLNGNYAIEFEWTETIPSRIFQNAEYLSDIVIPDGIQSIGIDAFHSCYALEHIVLPDSIEHIGASAFEFCNSLIEVDIPESTSIIDEDLFYSCDKLAKVTLPAGVTEIRETAFRDCEMLSQINLPESLTVIGSEAFLRTNLSSVTIPENCEVSFEAFAVCENLKNVIISEGVSFPGDLNCAFRGCTNLASVVIPGNVIFDGPIFSGCSSLLSAGPMEGDYSIKYGWTTEIPPCAFSHTGLKSIVFPNSINSIGRYAFGDCTNLTSVVIPDGVTSVGDSAFDGCTSLSSVTIPASATNIGESVFWDCECLTSAGPIGEKYSIEFGWTDQIPVNAFAFSNKLESIVIADSITSIGNSAFLDCVNLSSVTIPNSVTSIGTSTFSGCSKLESVGPIGESYNIQLGWKEKIPEGVFKNCQEIMSVVIPDGIQIIGRSAFFGCTNLSKVVIPGSVKSIDSYGYWAESAAFGECPNLTTAGLTKGTYSIEFGWTEEIPDNAFQGCDSLVSINIPDGISVIGASAFEDCKNLSEVSLPSSISSIKQYAFANCKKLSSVTLPTNITSIENSLFSGCSSLIDIIIPNSVVSIGDYAFYGCAGLTSVTIPGNVTSIGISVFDGCSGLASAGPIGRGEFNYKFGWIDVIPGYAFNDCSSLTSVTIPNSVTSIGEYAFSDCSGLTSMIIPDSVTSIGEYAFYECTGLTSVTIPDSVTSINRETFYDCSNLTSVTIPVSVTSIGDYAFYGCSGLTDVYYSGTEVQWNKVKNDFGNRYLTDATIHYYSTGPDDVLFAGGVAFLRAYDSSTGNIAFNGDEISIFSLAETADASDVGQLVGKYVIVTMNPTSILEVTSIEPVESKIGTVSTSGEHSMTVDGTTYPVREDLILYAPDGGKVLYHLSNNTIVGFTPLEKKTGSLESWNGDTGIAVIDGREYYTNYLSDLYNLTNAGEAMGKKVEFLLAGATNYDLILSLAFCPGFRITSSAAANSVMRGNAFDLYVGYYLSDGSLDTRTKQYAAVVSDGDVLAVDPAGWDDKYGQRFTVLARNIGAASITFTHPLNGEAVGIDLQVIDKEAGYRFSNVPKLTIEPGKTTNFYNYNGLVVDDFAYTAVRGPDGEVDHYNVTMTVYNTLNLYGAVTAYNAQGEMRKFYLIDKKTDMPSGLTDSIKDLIEETGDLFYLMGNKSYYSGKSISQETKVSIEVPAGGYIEISNSGDSAVVVCANMAGLFIEGLIKGGKVASSAGELGGMISDEEIIVSDVVEACLEGAGETAIQEAASALKNRQWTLDNYGTCLRAFLEQLKESGVDMVDAISKEINSLSGVASITESAVMSVVPTRKLIEFLYDVAGLGDQIIGYVNFWKCFTFSKGICIYAPAVQNAYISNGITVVPAAVDPDAVIHSYRVVNKNEAPARGGELSETYSITMYKGGQAVQAEAPVKVSIPLPQAFQSARPDQIKVYRLEEDGSATDMRATVVDGHAEFTTDHFSYYSLVVERYSLTASVNTEGQALQVTAVMKNTEEQSIEGTLTLAVYDEEEDGKLLSVQHQPVTVPSGESSQAEFTVGYTSGVRLKAFWLEAGTCSPVSTAWIWTARSLRDTTD